MNKSKTWTKRKANSKSKLKKFALTRKPKNLYMFKRLGNVVRIQHRAGAAGDVWNIEDPNTHIVNSIYATGASWGTEAIPGSYQNGFCCNFAINKVVDSSDFTALFDRYKIVGIKAKFMYQINNADAGGQSVLPTIMYYPDYDDNAAPTYGQMRVKQGVKSKVLEANKPFSIFFKPKRLVSVSDGAGNSNSMITNSGWLNSQFAGVNHLGLKFYINNLYGGAPATTTVNAQLEVQFTYYLAFKDPQ